MFRRKAQTLVGNKDETVLGSMKTDVSENNFRSTANNTSVCYPLMQSVNPSCRCGDKFCKILGFRKHDLLSADRFVRLLCRPSDPASIGILRMVFGFLVVIDVFEERGLTDLYKMFGSQDNCRFPLFNFLQPLSLQWMYIVYIAMLTGALGIMLGFKMSVSSCAYLTTYWYVFFLEKSAWNNHSNLFGILAFLFAVTDSNRFWSLDGVLDSKIQNSHIPLWNYTLMRAQIFLVYFIAGLKKLNMDWMSGYSMKFLSHHWVFNPFKVFLTEAQIDMYIVHLGGLLIDLALGFLLFLDKTRVFALILSSIFHMMNSQLFSIGIFPYTMLVTQLIFCDMNWPRKLWRFCMSMWRISDVCETLCQPTSKCVYAKESITCQILNAENKNVYTTSPTWKHKFASLFTVAFIALQIFLPYSHGITKGYNSWTNGLYGYSWDMMVHGWSVQHIRITYYDKTTGQSGYIDPMKWTGGSNRWSSHGDMIKQYANCISDNLKKHGINNVSVYFDIWTSLNYRFRQRLVDPRMDMIAAEWHPFRHSSWLMPLMVDLSDWRTHMDSIEASLKNEPYTGVTFFADFPGMYLENYIQPDFGNVTFTVLVGTVMLELLHEEINVTLDSGQSVQITAGAFHIVHTIAATPSCYMYMFVNTTEEALVKSYMQFERANNRSNISLTAIDRHWDHTGVEDSKSFMLVLKVLHFQSIHLSTGAIYCFATNNSLDDFLNATVNYYTTECDSVSSKYN